MHLHDAAIALHDIDFTWPGQTSPVLHIDALDVAPGEHLFISGPSGSGKSTLLGLIAGILTPQSGSINLLGTPLSTLSASQRDAFRADHIGFIFQQFNLIPYLSVVDNVLLPCRFSAVRRQRATADGQSLQAVCESLLQQLDLAPALWSTPVTQLSIGQQQRVAAARAFIGKPDIIIADEPTSALDSDRQQAFLELLMQACTNTQAALVFISHDVRLAERFTRHVAFNEINHVAHVARAARITTAAGQS
jgi:putative ABC transport system ATP-binding protein